MNHVLKITIPIRNRTVYSIKWRMRWIVEWYATEVMRSRMTGFIIIAVKTAASVTLFSGPRRSYPWDMLDFTEPMRKRVEAARRRFYGRSRNHAMKPGEDEGQSRRLLRRRSASAQPTCVLSVGSQRLPAAIAEERGGTLHVLIQGSPQFWVEDSGQLSTPQGELSVRVFNIVRVEEEEEHPAGSIPTFRIGLEQLGQVAPEYDPDGPETGETEADEMEDEAGGNSRSSPGGVLGVAVAIALLVSAAAAWRHYSGNGNVAPAKVGGENEAVSSNYAGQLTMHRPAGGSAATASYTPDLVRLPGVEPFVRPEVAKKLGLTPAQMGACQRLNRTTQDAVADLEKYWGSGGRLELAQKRNVLLDAARQEALELLTDPQRKLWNEMTR